MVKILLEIYKNILETLSDKNEVFLILINIIIFMIIQTLFFKYIISLEYENLIKEKLNTVNYYIDRDQEVKDMIIDYKNNNIDEIKNKSIEQKKIREEKNKKLYFYYCIIPILIALLIFIVIIILNYKSLIFKKSEKMRGIHYFNFALILLIYIPNMIIFFFVVKKYQFIGNIEILSTFYNNIINK
jgi:hypothetical protein